MDTEKILAKIYYDPENPASLGSAKTLYKAVKKKITLNEIKRWLSAQETYTLHKQARKKFTRRKVIARGINYQIQADLIDLRDLKRHNKGYGYILTAINVFSRKAAAVALKTKKSREMVIAIKKIISKLKPFKKLQTDQGTEFFNKDVKKLLKKNNIHHFFTASDLKSSIIERFNRTLKEKIFKYFSSKTTLTYINVLPKLIKAYNNKFHRSIGTTPNKVNKSNEKKIWNFQYKDYLKDAKPKFKFQINDRVKITKYRTSLDKGYLPKWSNEVFLITDRIASNPHTYKLRDMKQELIEGIFYPEELQKVTVPEDRAYPIRILKRRIRKGKTEYFVHFVGFPKSEDTWISKNQIQK